ncbi:family exonuclease [Leptolyngbya sp. Heron Island J]|nr:family exonuclease [Leptolyngbya sp. Heron Island J]
MQSFHTAWFYWDAANIAVRGAVLQKNMLRPLATEGRIQGVAQVNGLEFRLTGRYD